MDKNMLLDFIKQCDDEIIDKMYSQFSFFPFPKIFFEIKEDIVELFLFNCLKEFKFITYYFLNNKSNIQYNGYKTKANSLTTDIVICVEKICLLIKEINSELINKIINKLKDNHISMIDYSDFGNYESYPFDLKQPKEEIKSFIDHFSPKIKNNNFIQSTIPPIAGYLIRRYFYPKYYFKENSFFFFDQQIYFFYDFFMKEFIKNFLTINDEDKVNLYMKPICYLIRGIEENFLENDKIYNDRTFKEEDFVKLRLVYKNENARFYLVIHLESLYIFMMKLILPSRDVKKVNHEIDFCKNHRHRCFTKFYGFLKKEGKIIGFIYEYMCNGTLNSYIKSNKHQIDDIFILSTINRFFQGLDFLQSKSLIHRDLKPANILIDNDFIPYISDFETIRSIYGNENDIMTSDIGSFLYAAPEQYFSEKLTFATDIFAFGLIIYFLYEKKDMYQINGSLLHNKKESDIVLPITNSSENIQNIYKGCVQFKPESRIVLQNIKSMLCKEMNSFSYLLKYLTMEVNNATMQNIIQFFVENAMVLIGSDEKIYNLANMIMFTDFLYLKNIGDYSSFYYSLGGIHTISFFVKKNYMEAKKYFEFSAQYNNSDALLKLGYFYFYGYGVKQDYSRAKKYVKLAAKLNNSNAYYNLGVLYYNGFGVERNFLKAIEYMKLAAEQKYQNYFFYRSHNDLGLIYLLFFQENDKAFEYIKTSANGEYPNGENNYGLVNQLYYQNLDEAEYRFKKASKSNLSIADFNLGQLYENQNKIPESIEYYIRSTKQNIILTKNLGYYHYDAIFNLSSKFIICYANLKVAEHYLSQNNYKEGKIYFMNSFTCLRIYEIRSYKFEFQFDIHKKEKVFSYLKSFIILHPIFNLCNQPFSNITDYINDLKLELNESKNLQIQSESNFKNKKRQEVQMHNKNNEKNRFNVLYEKNKEKFSMFDEEIRNECLEKEIDDVRMFTDPSELFDFIINEEDLNLVKYLIEEIQEILCIMKKILYMPPYPILFGRLSQRIPIYKPKVEIPPYMKDINELFYEGLGNI